MSKPLRLLGAVLAGGAGRRYGAPKAAVVVGGETLVARAVSALAPVVESVIVVSSRPVPDVSATVVPDGTPGIGPLGALQAAVVEADARALDGVLVLACDLPLVDTALLARVRAAAGSAVAVAPERIGGGIEPLCAVYRTAARGTIAARIASGEHSMHGLFRALGGVTVPLADLDATAESFLNVNTPDDRERVERTLTGRPAPKPGP